MMNLFSDLDTRLNASVDHPSFINHLPSSLANTQQLSFHVDNEILGTYLFLADAPQPFGNGQLSKSAQTFSCPSRDLS
jgi:hypothetical protein